MINHSNSQLLVSRSEYDRGPNTFSPEGRLFQVVMVAKFYLPAHCELQVEYAIEAIKLGSTAIGIQTSEGVSCVFQDDVLTFSLR